MAKKKVLFKQVQNCKSISLVIFEILIALRGGEFCCYTRCILFKLVNETANDNEALEEVEQKDLGKIKKKTKKITDE